MSQQVPADLVIRGGTVIDGTGSAGYPADVAVSRGRIDAIGEGLAGRTVLDASGCVVSPGFIDIHTHYDAQVFWDQALTPSCYHGVTTVVAGNCGFSIAPTRPEHRQTIAATLERVEDMNLATLTAGVPWDFETFPEYLASVERRGVALNFAAYIGHTAVRLYVMADDASERAATPDEVAEMQRIVSEAMEQGAAGFATSASPTHRGADGRPVPSRLADHAEIDALFHAVGLSGRGIIEITTGDQELIARLYEMQPSVGVPITYAPLLTTRGGAHTRLLAIHRDGRRRGLAVWPQVTCRPVIFSMTLAEPFTLNPNPELSALMGAPEQQRRAAYADPAWRQRAVQAWTEMGDLSPRWDTYAVMESGSHPELCGRALMDIAQDRSQPPWDTLLDLALDEHCLADIRVRCVLMNDDTDALAEILNEPQCAIGLSDAGAHVGMLCDAPVPTDLLGMWVRERGTMPIEKAVRMLTGAQADLLNFPDRGYLRAGAWADIVVFDPAAIAPGPLRRVRDFPADGERVTADQPEGVRHVLVNGVPIRQDGHGVVPPAPPGRLLRSVPRTDTAAKVATP